jgi:polyhydroxyalkanoate synthesis regulator phasin
MEGHEKGISKLHKKNNRLHKMLDEMTRSVEKRKIYTQNADRFIRMLLQEGRTTKEELNQFFKPIKPTK